MFLTSLKRFSAAAAVGVIVTRFPNCRPGATQEAGKRKELCQLTAPNFPLCGASFPLACASSPSKSLAASYTAPRTTAASATVNKQLFLGFYDLAPKRCSIDGLLIFLSNNLGTPTGAIDDLAKYGPGVTKARFPITFPKQLINSKHDEKIQVLHGNAALVYAKMKIFGEDALAQEIVREVEDANECRDLGRKVQVASCDPEKLKCYEEKLEEIAFEIVRQKTIACPILQATLGATGEDVLFAHAAPKNLTWGTGHELMDHPDDQTKWLGRNLLGESWELLRFAMRVGSSGDWRSMTFQDVLEHYKESGKTFYRKGQLPPSDIGKKIQEASKLELRFQ